MTTALTAKQKEELHKSILDYLNTNGYTQSRDILKEEANQTEWQADPSAKWTGLLEKKWTGVIRLQKRIMDLESRNAQLQEELSSAPVKRPSASSLDWVPRLPPKYTLTGHRSPITRVTFHPLFSLIVSASEDSTIKVWDWETGDFERTLKGHTKTVQDVDFDSKGNLLVSCSSDQHIKIWDTNNEWKNIKTLVGHDHSISMARFLPNDEFIVSASRDKTIRIWEVANGFCIKTIAAHIEWVRSVIPSLDGSQLISSSMDHTSRIWDTKTGENKSELRGHDNQVEVAVFAPPISYAAIRELAGIPPLTAKDEKMKSNETFAATGSRDKTIKIWDTQSGQCLKTLVGHDNWVRSLVFHPSGKFLISSSDDKTIRIWDLATGRNTKTTEAHKHFISTMAWGRALVPGGGSTAVSSSSNNGVVNGNGIVGGGKLSNGTSGGIISQAQFVNVMATGSVDLSINIWLP